VLEFKFSQGQIYFRVKYLKLTPTRKYSMCVLYPKWTPPGSRLKTKNKSFSLDRDDSSHLAEIDFSLVLCFERFFWKNQQIIFLFAKGVMVRGVNVFRVPRQSVEQLPKY
jgi:hypothetical protein